MAMLPVTTAKKERSINIYNAGRGKGQERKKEMRKKKCGRKNASHKNIKNAPSPQRAAKENDN
jgi:hypothetical protein